MSTEATPSAIDSSDGDVSLREITASTVRAITDLRVAPHQEGYVASNAVSLAEAHFRPDAWCRALYLGDEPAGFVLMKDGSPAVPSPAPAELVLWRFMVDARFQGRGVGRRGIRWVLAHARSRPSVATLRTSCVAGPASPLGFYRSCGFRPTGEVSPTGELVLVHELARPA